MLNSSSTIKYLNKYGLMMMKRRDLLFTRIGYATSAQKKPTMTSDKSSSSSKDNNKESGKVEVTAVAAATATATDGSSGSSGNSNSSISSSSSSSTNSLRLVDYLSRKDLEMQRRVVMDMVTKSEVKFYDPPYLVREAPFPAYAELNINLKGYDFTVLEIYHNFIARLCRALDVDVKDVYAMPARSIKVKTYQPFSSNLDKEYSLKVYHRVVRVKDLKSTTAPLLFEAIQLNLPEGVQLSVGELSEAEENFRYVPDWELKELKEELEKLTGNASSSSSSDSEATATAASQQPAAPVAPATTSGAKANPSKTAAPSAKPPPSSSSSTPKK